MYKCDMFISFRKFWTKVKLLIQYSSQYVKPLNSQLQLNDNFLFRWDFYIDYWQNYVSLIEAPFRQLL